MAAQALALVALTILLLVHVLDGSTENGLQGVTEAVLVLAFAACAAGLAVALHRGRALAKTPTLVWNALLLPVSFSMISAGQHLIGFTVLAFAGVTFVAALTLPRPSDPDDDEQ